VNLPTDENVINVPENLHFPYEVEGVHQAKEATCHIVQSLVFGSSHRLLQTMVNDNGEINNSEPRADHSETGKKYILWQTKSKV
jgi:hypothetical protein